MQGDVRRVLWWVTAQEKHSGQWHPNREPSGGRTWAEGPFFWPLTTAAALLRLRGESVAAVGGWAGAQGGWKSQPSACVRPTAAFWSKCRPSPTAVPLGGVAERVSHLGRARRQVVGASGGGAVAGGGSRLLWRHLRLDRLSRLPLGRLQGARLVAGRRHADSWPVAGCGAGGGRCL